MHVAPRPWTAVHLMIAACLVAGCSDTVEASAVPEPPAPAAPTASPSSTPSPTPNLDAADAADCGPDDVDVTAGEVEANASSRDVRLTIRPSGRTACRVDDRIVVELLDAEGNVLPSRLEAGSLPAGKEPLATIASGSSATARIEWRVVPAGQDADPASDCVSADGIRVRLSAGATPIPVAAQLTACDRGTVTVTPPGAG